HTSFSRDWSSDVCSSDLGYEFADALAAAPYAAEKGIPILLTRSREFSPANEALFQNQNISRTYVVGGTSAIADKVVRGLPNVKQIGRASCRERGESKSDA